MFSQFDIRRTALSSLGALALSATCIGAAIAPAKAEAAPTSVAGWATAVERKLDTQADRYAVAMPSGTKAEAVLAVRFTADGDYAGADIARSSGNRQLDAHALIVADRLDYPRLPKSLRGQAQTVAMRLVFGRADTPADAARLERDARTAVRLASSDRAGSDQIAVK